MKNKIITELSNEELLNSLEGEESVEHYKDDILNFISFYNIKTGDERVPGSTVYFLYKNWSKVQLKEREFYNKFNKLFNKKRSDYLLNIEHMNISKLALEKINKTKSKTKNKKYKEHFEFFLSHYNLKGGDTWVGGELLFKMYLIWRKEAYKPRVLAKSQFYSFCRLYFSERRNYSKKNTWFAVNKISQEAYQKLKEVHAQEKEDNKTK